MNNLTAAENNLLADLFPTRPVEERDALLRGAVERWDRNNREASWDEYADKAWHLREAEAIAVAAGWLKPAPAPRDPLEKAAEAKAKQIVSFFLEDGCAIGLRVIHAGPAERLLTPHLVAFVRKQSAAKDAEIATLRTRIEENANISLSLLAKRDAVIDEYQKTTDSLNREIAAARQVMKVWLDGTEGLHVLNSIRDWNHPDILKAQSPAASSPPKA